jgi:HlyD family secretion protein
MKRYAPTRITGFLAAAGLTAALLTACSLPQPPGAPGAEPTAAPAVQATPPAPQAIVAEGTVRPARLSDLQFTIAGTVAEVLVAEGDGVAADAPLARLDTRDLAIAVERARASLAEAQASYRQQEAGATPEQIAAAQARVDQATAQLTQAQSSVTRADVVAAEAQLRQATARLEELRRGADPEPVAAAQARLEQAQANLASQRDALSTAKTEAESRLAQAANSLRNAQDEYSRIYWDNRALDRQPGDLPQARRDQEAAAQRAVADAEEGLRQAGLALEQAGQAEVTGIQSAEAQVRQAQADLAQTNAPAKADAIAAAEADVARAQASLASLRGPQRAGQVGAAEAGVREAQANLEQLAAPTREVDLGAALARVELAEVALRQAERDLEKATLRAPFAGTVGELNLDLGEATSPGGAAAAIILADTSAWRVETTDLTERDVVRIAVGDPVTVTFEAIPDLSLPGTVLSIKPLGTDSFGDITYTVVVTPDSWDERLRWQMSATVTVEP